MGRNGLTIYLAGKMGGLSDSEMKKWRNLLKSELEKYSDMAIIKQMLCLLVTILILMSSDTKVNKKL